jgi:hypothetical protein
MKFENLEKLEIASVVILSNESGELIPAMIMEFRENVSGYFAMVKIGADPNLVAIPINSTRTRSGYSKSTSYSIDYLVDSLRPIEAL